MQSQSVIIGRQGQQSVSIDDMSVSKRHLSATPMSDGRWSIEDLGSTNGTYVNGLPVVTAIVDADTPLMLGSLQTTLRQLLNLTPASAAKPAAEHNPEPSGIAAAKPAPMPASDSMPAPDVAADGSVSIKHLEAVYEKYRHDTLTIARRRNHASVYRILPMAVGMPLVMGLVGMFTTDIAVKGVCMGGLMAVGSALTLRMIPMGDRLAEEQFDLNRRFQVDYSCPCCHNFMGAAKPYEVLVKQGQCPFCKAKFRE